MQDSISSQAVREANNDDLVKMAKAGEKAAFNELFFRYRDKALGYAHHLAQDPHLAEDIVQDALISAFLHLGNLSHSGFVPWLQRIVRNQAMMRLRRGGPHGKERPLSGYTVPVSGKTTTNWADIGDILDYLTKRSSKFDKPQEGPAEILLHKEIFTTIKHMLRILSQRERQIFEAHFFFDQLSPDEIARLFDTTTGNVYKSISRSREKLTKERYTIEMQDALRNRLERTGTRRRMLIKPDFKGSTYPHPDLTFPNCLLHWQPYVGMGMTKHELAGWTNYAFKISVWKNRVGPLSMHDWNTFKSNALLNIGFHCRTMDIHNFGLKESPKKGFLVWQAVRMIRESIDRGLPAFLCDAIRPEFALIYGYDDEKQLFYAADTIGDGEVPYSTIGHRRTNSIYVVTAEESFDLHALPRLQRLLQLIIRHAHGGEAIFTSQINGLKAFDAWMDALHNDTADPLGHASNIHILVDSRESAVQFLSALAVAWAECEIEETNQSIRQFLHEAAQLYQEVYEVFRLLQIMFPFPDCGILDESGRKYAIGLLRQAKYAEERGVEVFERLLLFLQQLDLKGNDIPSLVQPSPFFLF